MLWKIINTDTFSKKVKKHKKSREFMEALDKRLERLKEDPKGVGGYLSARLHGYKSTRIIGKFRLIFRIDGKEKKVYLIAVDHRKFDYGRF